eukprot:jgi/Ulvmu1/4229/UM191_0002.1
MDGAQQDGGTSGPRVQFGQGSFTPTQPPWLNQTLQPQFPRISSSPSMFSPISQPAPSSTMDLSTPHSRPAPSMPASPNRITFATFNNQMAQMNLTPTCQSQANGSPSRSMKQMGTIRNVHGDSVIALDTPSGAMAVELTRSRSVGSSRHAVLNMSSPGSCRVTSRRSLSRKSDRSLSRRSLQHSYSGSDTSLPPVAMQHHDCSSDSEAAEDSCASSSTTEGTGSAAGTSSGSELGTVQRPVRALVATFQGSSEQILLSSMMHLQISVIVEFAVGAVGLRAALLQNHQNIVDSLSDCGFQLVLLEQRLVAESPEIVAMARGLTAVPLVLMQGSLGNCHRWGLDAFVPTSTQRGAAFDVAAMDRVIRASLAQRERVSDAVAGPLQHTARDPGGVQAAAAHGPRPWLCPRRQNTRPLSAPPGTTMSGGGGGATCGGGPVGGRTTRDSTARAAEIRELYDNLRSQDPAAGPGLAPVAIGPRERCEDVFMGTVATGARGSRDPEAVMRYRRSLDPSMTGAQNARVTFGDWTERLERYTQESLTDALNRRTRTGVQERRSPGRSPVKRFGTAWDSGWSAVATSRIAARKWIVSHPVEVDSSDMRM